MLGGAAGSCVPAVCSSFTTDYWPQKIVTTERIFDLDWRIFDPAEIEACSRWCGARSASGRDPAEATGPSQIP